MISTLTLPAGCHSIKFMESFITSTEAAELLGIARRTLLRWEERKWLQSQRDEYGNRIYRADHVRLAKHVWDQWVNIRRYHREHLRKLPALQREVERFIVTTPLQGTEDGRGLFSFKEMKEAFEKMEEWQEKNRQIHALYEKFLQGDAVKHVKLLARGMEAERIKSRS